MFCNAIWTKIVRGMCNPRLFKQKLPKLLIYENMNSYYIENLSDCRTIGNISKSQQSYPSPYHYYNHCWYQPSFWQNYYTSYNNCIMPFPHTNNNLFSYVPHFPYYNQYQYCSNPNSNGHNRGGPYNLRRGDRNNGRNHVYKVNKDMSLRVWEHLSSQSSKPGFIFSLMSYNVLAQDLLEKHPYLYQRHNPEALKWESRWKKLLTEIKKFNPDIICLQEVQESHIKKYYSALESLGYVGIYKKRTGIRTDGCSIYYKEDNVKLIDYMSVEFFKPDLPRLNRDNVGLVAKFAPKNHPLKEFVIATTHLLYNPRRNDVRLAQMQLFLSEIDKFSYQSKFGKPSHVPVILTGDLNTQPDSELYQQIISGQINYTSLLQDIWKKNSDISELIPATSGSCHQVEILKDKLDKVDVSNSNAIGDDVLTSFSDRGCLIDNFSFRSVYDHGDRQNFEGTTYQDEWLTVDYIFYSVGRDKKSGNKLKLLSRWRLPTREELEGVFIPNEVFGSDHLSLIAKFKLEF